MNNVQQSVEGNWHVSYPRHDLFGNIQKSLIGCRGKCQHSGDRERKTGSLMSAWANAVPSQSKHRVKQLSMLANLEKLVFLNQRCLTVIQNIRSYSSLFCAQAAVIYLRHRSFICVCVGRGMEARGQFSGVVLLLSPCESRDPTLVISWAERAFPHRAVSLTQNLLLSVALQHPLTSSLPPPSSLQAPRILTLAKYRLHVTSYSLGKYDYSPEQSQSSCSEQAYYFPITFLICSFLNCRPRALRVEAVCRNRSKH